MVKTIGTKNNIKQKKMITKEELLEFGMKEQTDEIKIFTFIKDLCEPDEENNLEAMSICVTQIRNQPELCFCLPDGAIVFLGGVETIGELKVIEKSITSWEPNC